MKSIGLGFHLAIFAVLGLITLVTSILLNDQHLVRRADLQTQAKEQRMNEIAHGWASPEYQPLEVQQFMERFRLALKSEPVAWPELRKKALLQEVEEVIEYLESPSLKEYIRLRTEGVDYEFRLSGAAERLVGRRDEGQPQDGAGNAGQSTELAWRSLGLESHGGNRPRLTEFAPGHIEVGVSKDPAVTAVLGGDAAKGFTGAARAINPGFYYSEEGIDKAGGQTNELFFHFSFFAKANTSTNASPVHVSLEWLEEDQQWVPHSLFTDIVMKFPILF